VGVIEGGYVYLVYEFNVHIQTSGVILVGVCVLGVRQKAEVGVDIGVRPLEYNNNPEISLPVAL